MKDYIRSIRFDTPLYRKIEEYAKKEHRSFSEMLRYMALDYIRRKEKEREE